MIREEIQSVIDNGGYLYDLRCMDLYGMEAIYKPEILHKNKPLVLRPVSWWSDGWTGSFQNGYVEFERFREATPEEIKLYVK